METTKTAPTSFASQLSAAFVLLRVHFSLFLMPVYWLALWQAQVVDAWRAAAVFAILHLLVYPASNGFNCYYDKDEGPIGGLEHPPLPNRLLLALVWLLDLVALAWAYAINHTFALMVLTYVIASRAYSHPSIHLKRGLFTGTFTVVFFQGAFTYLMVMQGLGNNWVSYLKGGRILFVIASSLLLLGTYPVSQVFQHEEDSRNGIQTLSLALGLPGTFRWAMLCTLPAFGLLLLGAAQTGQALQLALGGLILLLLPYRYIQQIGYLLYHQQPSVAFFKPVTKALGIVSVTLSVLLFVLFLAK